MTIRSPGLSAARGSRVKSVRCDADQAVDAGQQTMAELLHADGYIVPVRPTVPVVIGAVGMSTGDRQSVLEAGPARNHAK